jgi:PKD repeat protein
VTVAATNGSPIRDVTVNWGDGQVQDLGALTGATNSVFHTYQSPGAYSIKATVVDSYGTSVPVSSSVVVNPKPQPTVSLTLTNATTTPTAGTDTAFTAMVTPPAMTGAVIQSVSINYGDGTPAQDLGAVVGNFSLHHVFAAAGTYNIALTAQDSNGGVGTAFTSVFVQAATPLGVTLTASATIGASNTIETFTATVTGLGNAVVTSYLWDFGDQTSQVTTTNQVTHSYKTNGGINYTVRVTITTSSNGTASNTIAINP